MSTKVQEEHQPNPTLNNEHHHYFHFNLNQEIHNHHPLSFVDDLDNNIIMYKCIHAYHTLFARYIKFVLTYR